MNNPAGDSQSRRHNLSDWLALHELDPVICRRILNAMTSDASGEAEAQKRLEPGQQTPNLDAAWLTTLEAMRAFLPEQKGIIDDTFEKTARILADRRDKSPKALTLDNGPTAYPTIVYSYLEPADSLVIAHEFGHALQIRASRGKFVPPIIREACAFLGESALLSHSLQGDAARHAGLVRSWQVDNARYLGVQRDRLEAALSRPDSLYRYSWNYPIARYLAIQISERCSRAWIWNVFEGEVTVRDALVELRLSSS